MVPSVMVEGLERCSWAAGQALTQLAMLGRCSSVVKEGQRESLLGVRLFLEANLELSEVEYRAQEEAEVRLS